jgi:hypothetical protein
MIFSLFKMFLRYEKIMDPFFSSSETLNENQKQGFKINLEML